MDFFNAKDVSPERQAYFEKYFQQRSSELAIKASDVIIKGLEVLVTKIYYSKTSDEPTQPTLTLTFI